jgi:hypothetical protein
LAGPGHRRSTSPPLAAFPGLPRYGAIVFLVSFALLNAQVTVTRLLAYRFFYHFVFLVISLAQLGLAAAGAWLFTSRGATWTRADLARWLLGLAALPVAILVFYGRMSPEPNLSLTKLDGPPAHAYLAGIAVLLTAVNLCGGMALTMLFSTFRDRIGALYAADLGGAASGCAASVGLLMLVGPVRAFLSSGIAAACAVLVLGKPGSRAPSAEWLVAAAAVLVLLGVGMTSPEVLVPSRTNPASGETILRAAWDHLARVDAVRPGRYVIDGDASTDFRSGGRQPPAPEYEVVRPRPEVAIIGVGAGPELRVALRHRDAARVLAIDINPTIVRWGIEEDRDFNRDLFHDPRVELVVGEGRHVLRSSERDYDLIVMHAIDTWTASAQGAYSLTENFLYTVEAMRDFVSKLRPGGVVSIRRWLFWPPRENLRLFTTVHDALAREGAERPADHIVVLAPEAQFRDPDRRIWGYLLFSDIPFSSDRLDRLDRFVESQGWSYLYRPGRPLETPFQDFVQAENKESFYDGYPYRVRPARDCNPFFFQLARPWSSWSRSERTTRAIYKQSSTLLALSLALTTGLTVALLGVPLVLRRRERSLHPQRWSALVYFACLGLGFMAFELPVIQVMVLFLGHPTYALSVVLLGLLAAAGLGSRLMGRAPAGAGPIALAVASALALASALGLLPLAHALIQLPGPARALVTLAYLAVIGVPLGMPFVAGIRLLDPDRPGEVAWAWAVNGATAVVGTCLLMIVMVYGTSSAALLIGAGCYATALVAHRRLAAFRGVLGTR